MSLISVIIPCFNCAKFISETVESVLAQEGVRLEIIVVDDGSTDNSSAAIRAFGRHVRAEFGPNRGASAARNRGTTLANGSLIQYLDADDVLVPGALKRRAEALAHSGGDVAYSDWQRIVELRPGAFRQGQKFCRNMESVHRDPEIAIFTDFWCPPAALLYKRSIVQRIGGWNESLPVIQDARFLLDAALQGAQFVHVCGVGALYRVHMGQSLSRTSKAAFVQDCYRNATQVERFWVEHGGLSDTRRAALIRVYESVVRSAFDADRPLFEASYRDLLRLDAVWRPSWSRSLGQLSAICGYRRAEQIASRFRRIKALVRPAYKRLAPRRLRAFRSGGGAKPTAAQAS